MEELHTDSIDGGHEGQLWARSRARERAYSNTCNMRSMLIRNSDFLGELNRVILFITFLTSFRGIIWVFY
jgi:hypothetical protein